MICLGQTKQTIDLRRIMDEGQLFIANLSKGLLGEGHANLLGGLLISSFQLVAQSRADVTECERRPFYLYADEFQNYSSNSFATILSEAHKYGLGLTIAHQYLDQLPDDIRSAIVKEFDHMSERQFIEADRYMVHARILKDGIPYQYRLLTEPPYSIAGGHRDDIIKQSALRFGYASEKVEKETAHFFK